MSDWRNEGEEVVETEQVGGLNLASLQEALLGLGEMTEGPVQTEAVPSPEQSVAGSDVREGVTPFDYRTNALRQASALMEMARDDTSNYVDADVFQASGKVGQHAIQIRPAVDEDLPGIIDLASELANCSRSPFRLADDDKIRADRRQDMQGLPALLHSSDFGAFVACDEQGRLLGHVLVKTGITEFLTGEEQAWIFDIAVRPELWGSGISKRLLQEAERFAISQGMRYMGLTVTAANSRALRFYQHSGYQDERHQMVKILQPIALEDNL